MTLIPQKWYKYHIIYCHKTVMKCVMSLSQTNYLLFVSLSLINPLPLLLSQSGSVDNHFQYLIKYNLCQCSLVSVVNSTLGAYFPPTICQEGKSWLREQNSSTIWTVREVFQPFKLLTPYKAWAKLDYNFKCCCLQVLIQKI